MKLVDGMMIIVLQRISVCAASSVCQETAGNPVVHGCENNHNRSSTILLDTSSNYQTVKCRCVIAFSEKSTRLVLVADNGIQLYNHTIQIEDLVLNSSATSGAINLTTKANLWLTSGDKGGTCVTISANNRITVSCYAQQNTTAVTATTINTKSKMPIPTASSTRHTEEYFSSTRDLQDNNIDNTVDLTGPVAGGVSGFVVLVVATTVIAIYCKRRNASNRKESNGQHRHADSANTDPDIYTTENPMYERADGDDRLPFLGGTSQVPSQNITERNSESGRLDDINSEYQYISDIEQVTGNQNNERKTKLLKYSTETEQPQKDHSTETSSMEWNADGINLPEYSAYDKLDDNQTVASENNVYNCTNNPNNPTHPSWNDDYHHLGTVSGSEQVYNRTKKSLATPESEIE